MNWKNGKRKWYISDDINKITIKSAKLEKPQEWMIFRINELKLVEEILNETTKLPKKIVDKGAIPSELENTEYDPFPGIY